MIRAGTVILASIAAALLPAGTAVAADEERPGYPHGDYSEDCRACHTSEGWTGKEVAARFDHAKVGFPLTGSHAGADCRACHATLEFAAADRDCVSCHLDVHRAELGVDCDRCHTSRSFIDRSGMARAHLATRFPLRGAHRVTDCDDCHRPVAQGALQYVTTSLECDACHLENYLATTDPNHQAESFPHTCQLCHADHGWTPTRFDHGSLAAGTPCASCHLEDYQATTDPDHRAENFPEACETCHSTRGWSPASFDHDSVAAGSACATCHLDDYQATTDPDHQASGFPQACESCHSTSVWVPASFNGLSHDGAFFPIYSGRHSGVWDRCTDCHLVPNNFSQFSCIDCHEHNNANEVAGHHDEVSGYVFDSRACYDCHPRGRE